jgi:hypothetical protein
MSRSVASWLADNPAGAVAVTGLLGLLPLLGFSFLFFMPGAVPALTLLVRGTRQGMLVAAGAAVFLAGAMWLMGRPLPVGLVYASWVLLPPLVLAELLLRIVDERRSDIDPDHRIAPLGKQPGLVAATAAEVENPPARR